MPRLASAMAGTGSGHYSK